jgi:hypothetical protein
LGGEVRLAVMFSLAANLMFFPPLAVVSLWYALPLVVSVSLVCAATRHELMRPIVEHAVRFAAWLVVFMVSFMVLLGVLEWMA